MTRFWSKVDRLALSGCWTWTASRTRTGYGYFRLAGKNRRAHRVAWELTHGAIPPGVCVCHSCDNSACVNPAHLFLGTQQDNIADMCLKDRQVKSADTKLWLNKLTANEVRAIRALVMAGGSLLSTGRLYGVHSKTVRQIVHRETYKHVA